MLIGSLSKPLFAAPNDLWYCFADRRLYENHSNYFQQNVWMAISSFQFVSLHPPTSITAKIWIDASDPDMVPHEWSPSSQSWIRIIPPGFILPPQNPIAGDIWTDTNSTFQYIYTGLRWSMVGSAYSTNGIGVSPSIGQVPPPYVLTTQSAPSPKQTLSITPLAIKISGVVEIFMDGSIVYESGYTPDAAAIELWKAIAHLSPTQVENREITKLREENDKLRWMLQLHADAGHQLPTPKRAPDPDAAWDAAMGVII